MRRAIKWSSARLFPYQRNREKKTENDELIFSRHRKSFFSPISAKCLWNKLQKIPVEVAKRHYLHLFFSFSRNIKTRGFIIASSIATDERQTQQRTRMWDKCIIDGEPKKNFSASFLILQTLSLSAFRWGRKWKKESKERRKKAAGEFLFWQRLCKQIQMKKFTLALDLAYMNMRKEQFDILLCICSTLRACKGEILFLN